MLKDIKRLQLSFVQIYNELTSTFFLCCSFAASYRCFSSWTLSWLSSLRPALCGLSTVREGTVLLKRFLWRWKKRWCRSEILCRCFCMRKRRMIRGGGGSVDMMRPLLSPVLWRGCRGVGRHGSRTWSGVGPGWAPWWMWGGIVSWPEAFSKSSWMGIWPLS